MESVHYSREGMARKEVEAAAHSASSTVGKQREMNAGTQLALSLLFNVDSEHIE